MYIYIYAELYAELQTIMIMFDLKFHLVYWHILKK